MKFLRRNQYLLCFLAVLVCASVLVVRQFLANQSAHVELREDFILLHDRGEAADCDDLYQRLIQELATLDEKALVDDFERTSLLADSKSPDPQNLVWRYHVSVKKELEKRSEQRLARILGRGQKQ
jgi:cell division protein FtsL